jgi:hypothetical protein
MSRSIRTKASARFIRAGSTSTSVNGKWLLPILSGFPPSEDRSHFFRVYVFC